MTGQHRAGAMLSAERQRRLYRRLLERGSIRVAEEAQAFRVSDETIRRDIKALARAGVADPVFGGAVATPGCPPAAELPPATGRERNEQQRKVSIGLAASRLVKSGQIIILDGGTTTLSVARSLRDHADLTIITNSLLVAQIGARRPTWTVYVVGGKLIPTSLSIVGPQARRELNDVTADWAFLGAVAISGTQGFSSANPEEAEVKRAMLKSARETAVVADHTKFLARGFATFASTRDIQMLFTTVGAPAADVAALRKAGTMVEICSEKNCNGAG